MRRIATLIVLLFAWALLLYHLTPAPPGFQHDQTFTVWDALDVRGGQLSFYFFRNFGREPVFMYSVAAATMLLGDQLVWALRFTSIVWGMLAFVLTTSGSCCRTHRRCPPHPPWSPGRPPPNTSRTAGRSWPPRPATPSPCAIRPRTMP